MKTFRNLIEAQQFFKDENTCWKYWEQKRWNGTPVCPHCATTAIPYKLQGRQYKCSDKDCRKKFTALVGTIFESTKLPLQKWFLAIYIISAHKKGISSHQLARDLGITQKSAWFVLHRVREMLTATKPEVLQGLVEVDEAYIGGKETNKHQSPNKKHLRWAKNRETQIKEIAKGKQYFGNKTAVFGILERGGKVVSYVVPRVDGATLLPLIVKHVPQGSHMVSDDLNMYRNVTKLGYTHSYVKHSQQQYVDGITHAASIDGYWSLLKRGILGIYHYVSPKHLQRYCDEFAYRYNTREVKDVERFNDCFINAEGKRLTYQRLIDKKAV